MNVSIARLGPSCPIELESAGKAREVAIVRHNKINKPSKTYRLTHLMFYTFSYLTIHFSFKGQITLFSILINRKNELQILVNSVVIILHCHLQEYNWVYEKQ